MTRTELIAALERGPGSEKLDEAVLLSLYGQEKLTEMMMATSPHWGGVPLPRPTRSLDDAVKVVVPKGWSWAVRYDSKGARGEVSHEATQRVKTASAPTTSLALCAAAFKEG